MKKTNAVRILDNLDIEYGLRCVELDETDLSAERAAALLGLPSEQVFKTLVATGDKSGVIVASLPGGSELDLKALARLSGNKKVDLVPLKDIQKLTGYIRGAVSPLGMKHRYPYYLDISAYDLPFIIVSAGVRGFQIEIEGTALKEATAAVSGKIKR